MHIDTHICEDICSTRKRFYYVHVGRVDIHMFACVYISTYVYTSMLQCVAACCSVLQRDAACFMYHGLHFHLHPPPLRVTHAEHSQEKVGWTMTPA